ncbi:class I SAM-dependent methyltransferase [Paenibacillus alkalitolerans]|uniref:class I SAM-dependent methyltransferase n=1 Tax=Paenibacillus alkalitolerans TaxID=2799335 RepID=UPI0018F7417F|nr:class I SAM-dependent methyltransferase [Paenibacillus alkalitolerans]
MNCEQLKSLWISEERKTFKGWDFSYLAGRASEEQLPWDYRSIVLTHMGSGKNMLDMGTGGGEFLLSLDPPKGKTFATEGYAPNYELCKRTLPDYGIDVRQVHDDRELPFEDHFFDLIINRHEAFDAQEVFRILKPGGMFVTQQVGGQNNRELSKLLLGNDSNIIDAAFGLGSAMEEISRSGLTIVEGKEFFPILTFYDVGALVYFAKVIEWEFPGFSVDRCYDKLCFLQEQVEQQGCIQSTEHRFLIVARK